jgi:hypothetical protein
MRKRKRSKQRTAVKAADAYLQLDAISGSKDPEVHAFYEKAHKEEFAVYFDWLERHSSADGCGLLVPSSEAAREFKRAMDRVHMRAGYRFIHLLPPVMQKRLREVYPPPPGGGKPALGLTG